MKQQYRLKLLLEKLLQLAVNDTLGRKVGSNVQSSVTFKKFNVVTSAVAGIS